MILVKLCTNEKDGEGTCCKSVVMLCVHRLHVLSLYNVKPIDTLCFVEPHRRHARVVLLLCIRKCGVLQTIDSFLLK